MLSDGLESGAASVPAVGSSGPAPLALVLITPARNEAAFIEATIQAVVAQTARPLRWIIVSDGSTDGTDEIISRYAAGQDWIELVRLPERRDRSFAGKVGAFNAGYATVKNLQYDVIGNLDADITFEPDYLAFLLAKFQAAPHLGVAGTPFREGSRQYDYRFTSIEHVSGACQLFRRDCFDEIGGYHPIAVGGVDLIAVITARMKGWSTRSFPEMTCVHHRPLGTAERGRLEVAFKGGVGDYLLGMHPLWETCRTFYQITKRPFLVGGSLRLCGFLWAMARRMDKVIPQEVVAFRRKEQMLRLRAWGGRLGGFRVDPAK
jgi:poly-beta-1,6-N-acetyl-D-glucosamine synthase